MGMDLTVRILKYNEETNFYEELKLFRQANKYDYSSDSGLVKVEVYPGRNSEMFEGMRDGDRIDGYGYFPWTRIKLNSLEPELRKEIEELQNTEGYFDFKEISFAEMELYLLTHPTVVDYDSDKWDDWKNTDPKPQMENPIKSNIYERILSYISLAENCYMDFTSFSDYKIIFYFDY